MKEIKPPKSTFNTLIHFPNKDENISNGASPFVTIHSPLLLSDFGNFSILKNIENANLKVNRRKLTVVIKKNSISLDKELEIAGKYFSEIKEDELVYFNKKQDYYLNKLTLEELNLDVEYTRVKKGKYLISFYDDRIKILFTLSKRCVTF